MKKKIRRHINPKGTLILIGGAEDKGEGRIGIETSNAQFEKFEIINLLLKLGHKHRIEVITTASEDPKAIERDYKKAFKKAGFSNVGYIFVDERIDGSDEKFVKRIKKARVVFFSGGDQFRISTILGGTRICELLREKYYNEEKFVLAGTSSGAMVMGKVMIADGKVEEALLIKDFTTYSGMGYLDNAIVDTHFIKRGRFGRLSMAVVVNPGVLGIGLGEDTALLIKKGSVAECYGSGMVVIIDGKGIQQSNITNVEDDCPIYIESLKVHLLVKGCIFSLKDRRMNIPAKGKKKKSAC